ncbi:hypothetical protein BD626DRAFT_575838 [Schizophyllum amplum]|uniref:Uncharacterized protein n=1 Tax=Schizophyllum amplum TaxID=97359 RepID=A0A550BUU8_9AGAR|nr:hypothetical protein BD626DRAFT_575838 [Auriculariopsis ampla]
MAASKMSMLTLSSASSSPAPAQNDGILRGDTEGLKVASLIRQSSHSASRTSLGVATGSRGPHTQSSAVFVSPLTVSTPRKADASVPVTPPSKSAKKSKNAPTMPAWMNTRNTKRNSEESPPQVDRSPKKKIRQVSPKVPSPEASTDVVLVLEYLLQRAKAGLLKPIPRMMLLGGASSDDDDGDEASIDSRDSLEYADSSSGEDGSPLAEVVPIWRKAKAALHCEFGSYPGTVAVALPAMVRKPLICERGEAAFDWEPYAESVLVPGGFYAPMYRLPVACGFDDVYDGIRGIEGWDDPFLGEIMSVMDESRARRFAELLMFEQHGPFINEAAIDPSAVVALETYMGSGVFRLSHKDTRLPAISVSFAVVRSSCLDEMLPDGIRYMYASLFQGLRERQICLECTVFGARVLRACMRDNALKFATMANPDADDAVAGSEHKPWAFSADTKLPPFEPQAGQSVPVFDARHNWHLFKDPSYWPAQCPQMKGPIPNDSVAIIVHTTTMTFGRAHEEREHDVHHNVMFVVVYADGPVASFESRRKERT